jgi:acetyltransferase-like isoleucine patch superfamily enzyme
MYEGRSWRRRLGSARRALRRWFPGRSTDAHVARALASEDVRRSLLRSLEPQVREAVAAEVREAVATEVAELRRTMLDGALDERMSRLIERALPDPLHTPLVFGDRSRLHVHSTADVNNALFNLSSGTVTVGAHAFFGHNVSLLTGTHDIAQRGPARMQGVPSSGRDIVIEEGAWLATNVTVQGPCRIGRDAVVAAGSVVVNDVPAETVVAGIPARPLRPVPPSPTQPAS